MSYALFDLQFPSPVIASSYTEDLHQLLRFTEDGLGGFITKTILKTPSPGNPMTNIIILYEQVVMLNCLGLNTEGEKAEVARLKNKVPKDMVWGISISGHTDTEIFNTCLYIIKEMKSWNNWFIELNVSCNNVEGGHALANDLKRLLDILKLIRERSQRVISVKLSPNMPNNQITEICKSLKDIKKVCVNLGNSRKTTRTAERGLAQYLSMENISLSGKPLYERTLEMTTLTDGLPFISTGGILTPNQIDTLLRAGASLVGIATGLKNEESRKLILEYSNQLKVSKASPQVPVP